MTTTTKAERSAMVAIREHGGRQWLTKPSRVVVRLKIRGFVRINQTRYELTPEGVQALLG